MASEQNDRVQLIFRWKPATCANPKCRRKIYEDEAKQIYIPSDRSDSCWIYCTECVQARGGFGFTNQYVSPQEWFDKTEPHQLWTSESPEIGGLLYFLKLQQKTIESLQATVKELQPTVEGLKQQLLYLPSTSVGYEQAKKSFDEEAKDMTK